MMIMLMIFCAIYPLILAKLQQKDEFCKNIFNQIEKGNIIDRHLYKIDNKLLKKIYRGWK